MSADTRETVYELCPACDATDITRIKGGDGWMCGTCWYVFSTPLRLVPESASAPLARVRALVERWEGFMRDANEQGDATKAFAYAVCVLELKAALTALGETAQETGEQP